MNAPPTTPHYTRLTAAWKARITPERSRAQYAASPRSKKPPRVLPIMPQDPNKPCYFSHLPRELRLQVYEYILPQDLWLSPASLKFSIAMKQKFKPALLHVCGLMRLEVAALLYGSTHISYNLSTFDFRPLESWLSTIPAEHGVYLARNKNLTVALRGNWRTTLKEQLELCETFGNRYLIPKGALYDHFIHFCQLTRWTQWCGKRSSAKKLHWNYVFESNAILYGRVDKLRYMLSLREWFDSYLWTIAQPNVQRAWVRNVRKGTMKRELQKILASVDAAWLEQINQIGENLEGGSSSEQRIYDSWREEWDRKVAIVSGTIRNW